jgi:hypothetical protein
MGETMDGTNGKAKQPPNLRHGGFARQPLAALPRKAEYLRKKTARFRALLEKATRDKHGSISVAHAMAIQNASTHFALAEIWQRRLRLDHDTMDHATLADTSDRVSREIDRRDQAIARLGLDGAPPSIASLLFGAGRSQPSVMPNGSGAQSTSTNAGDA